MEKAEIRNLCVNLDLFVSCSPAPARKPAAVFCSAAAPPPGCMLDINDPQVQKAAIRIQASYQDHR